MGSDLALPAKRKNRIPIKNGTQKPSTQNANSPNPAMKKLVFRLVLGFCALIGAPSGLRSESADGPRLVVSIATDGGLVLKWDSPNLVLLRCTQLGNPIWWRVPGSSPVTLPVVDGKRAVPVYWPVIGKPAPRLQTLDSAAQFFCLMDAASVDRLRAEYAAPENLDRCRGGDCEACVDFCKGYALNVDFLFAGFDVGEAVQRAEDLDCGDDGLRADLETIGGVASAVYHARFGP